MAEKNLSNKKNEQAPFIVSLEDHYLHPKVWDSLPATLQKKYKL